MFIAARIAYIRSFVLLDIMKELFFFDTSSCVYKLHVHSIFAVLNGQFVESKPLYLSPYDISSLRNVMK